MKPEGRFCSAFILHPMRLFIAIPLPPDAIAAVRRFGDAARDAFPGFRWITPELLHITLKFLGDVDDITTDAARKALGGVVTGPPLQLKFGRTALLGPRHRPGVLALKLAGEADEVTQLAAKVEDAFARLGFDREPRPFLPHVTIARLARDATPPVKSLPEMPGPPNWFQVRSVRLMTSTLGGPTPVYETVLDLPMIDPDFL
jgi:2'-5' RNA ligase